jgi:hypothetical protein
MDNKYYDSKAVRYYISQMFKVDDNKRPEHAIENPLYVQK